MAKKIQITESQYSELLKKKKNEVKVIGFIMEDIDKLEKRLNESSILSEGVIDVLKDYVRRGLLTAGVIGALLSSNYVNAQQLQQAGIPQTTISQAMQTNKSGGGNEMSDQQIDKVITRNLQRNGFDGGLKQYQSLPQDQKLKVIEFVRSQVQQGKEIDDIVVKISAFVKGTTGTVGQNVGQIAQKKVGEKIVVDTAYVKLTLPIKGMFKVNSWQLNQEEFRTQLQDTLNSFYKVDSIVIHSSSSTLRNTGEAEGLTWTELSQKRANSLIEILDGMTYNLGGKGVNPTQSINGGMIKIDIMGSNGDGTSGPPSPYEVNPEVVKQYKERNIDPKFWDSKAEGQALENKADYEQYQYVNVIVYGQMVETVTEDIINYKYVSLLLSRKGKGGGVEKIKTGQKVDIGSCPIKIAN